MAHRSRFYNGDIMDMRRRVEDLIDREYPSGGVKLPERKYQIAGDLDNDKLDRIMIDASSTEDLDEASGEHVRTWSTITARAILVGPDGRLELGSPMVGGDFERSPSGVHKNDPAKSLRQLVRERSMPAGSWVVVEEYNAQHDPRRGRPRSMNWAPLWFVRVWGG